ncbi:MAG: type II secretion system F family protein [Solirubrobacterales bacterium]
MSAAAALAALALLLSAAALREMLGGGARPPGAALPGPLSAPALAAGLRLGVPGRIARAGLGGRLRPVTVLLAKAGCALAGALAGLAAAPAAPGRLSWLILAGLPCAGFLVPDALLERSARRRHARLLAALPDALDILSTGAALGRGTASGFGQVASATDGPLARELGVTVAEVTCGVPMGVALAALRRRVAGGEVAALCAAIERSRRFGSPLAEELRGQARTLRGQQRRAVSERAARAAPKIQLVVALVLVPSVLLLIGAALVANADRLLAGFG